MMTSAAYTLLAHSWSGLVISAIVGLLGWLIARAAHWLGRRWIRFAGYAIYGLAGLLAIGSVVAIVRIGEAERRYPPMGRLVDVGGYRMHILAEGDAHGGPTLIWISGGHDTDLELYHLHKIMQNETRSILFDRPGTGWSDTGPFPRSTPREAKELATLLENAGERGPFIVIGHSYGGLLAANFARRYPEKTAAAVLLDATPPDVFTYLPGGGGPDIPISLVRRSERAGWLSLFGLGSNPNREAGQRDRAVDPRQRFHDELLAEVQGQLQAVRARPAAAWTAASVFREWFDPKGIADLLVYDGELGNLPVYVVTPGDNDPKDIQQQLGLTGDDLRRAINSLQRSRMRYLSTSTKSEWVRTPAGTGHVFPHETPDVVVDLMRRILAQSRQH